MDKINPAMPKDREFATAAAGGCWFCYRKYGDLVLDTTFDTYVHVNCIKIVLNNDPTHKEAILMKYLIRDIE